MHPLEATALLAYYQTAAMSDENPFDISSARVFAIDNEGQLKMMISTPDVYMGLKVLPAAYDQLGEAEVIGVETCGWASPFESTDGAECAPSEHPRRRRVRLVAVVNRVQDVASALAFEDEMEDVQTNISGDGCLAEALKDCMSRITLMQSLPPGPSR